MFQNEADRRYVTGDKAYMYSYAYYVRIADTYYKMLKDTAVYNTMWRTWGSRMEVVMTVCDVGYSMQRRQCDARKRHESMQWYLSDG